MIRLGIHLILQYFWLHRYFLPSTSYLTPLYPTVEMDSDKRSASIVQILQINYNWNKCHIWNSYHLFIFKADSFHLKRNKHIHVLSVFIFAIIALVILLTYIGYSCSIIFKGDYFITLIIDYESDSSKGNFPLAII